MIWVRDSGEFKITEFEIASFNCTHEFWTYDYERKFSVKLGRGHERPCKPQKCIFQCFGTNTVKGKYINCSLPVIWFVTQRFSSLTVGRSVAWRQAAKETTLDLSLVAGLNGQTMQFDVSQSEDLKSLEVPVNLDASTCASWINNFFWFLFFSLICFWSSRNSGMKYLFTSVYLKINTFLIFLVDIMFLQGALNNGDFR